MRKGCILVVMVALGVMASGPAGADEIVRFTNGTFMSIRSHELKDDMVRVVLGTEAEMAFPLSMVESIEVGGQNVLHEPSTTANRAVDGPATSESRGSAVDSIRDYPVTATRPARSFKSNSARRREKMASDPSQLLGMPTGPVQPTEVRPGEGRKNRSGISLVGDRSLYQGNGEGGQSNVIGTHGAPRQKVQAITIQKRSTPNLEPSPRRNPPGGDSDKSSSGSGESSSSGDSSSGDSSSGGSSSDGSSGQ